MGRKIISARIKSIYGRQLAPTWDQNYQPSILATRQEAPSHSSASKITFDKFHREIHLLSQPELHLCIFALHHPNIVGLQEQRILSPVPSVHPLSSFEGVDKLSLPSLQGTLNVAERLGFSEIHQKLKIKGKSGFHEVTIPFIGDFLFAIAINDEIKCLDWSVKSQQKNFTEIELYQFDKVNKNSNALAKLLARHQLEKVYYEDANIRTVFISEDQIDKNVLLNLRQIFLYHRRCKHLLADQRAELFHYFQTAIQSGIPPAEVVRKFELKGKYSPEESLSILYQLIWHRKIRIDLFQPILIDRPLEPEKKDVFEVYADFFRTSI
ncbi:MAG: TnsA endonuclease C-terminal domain-containing protein [Methylotenera sp.]|nr:TnsA endonuclease C-terminal domain-containing protein [Methylotenera sp.]